MWYFIFQIMTVFFLSGCTGLYQNPNQQAYDQARSDLQEIYARQQERYERQMEEIKARPQKRQQRREEYVKAHPRLPASIRKMILEGMVRIGMTTEQVRASYGDEPDNINRSVYTWGVKEQWVYGDQYLYFNDGKLDSWQDSSR